MKLWLGLKVHSKMFSKFVDSPNALYVRLWGVSLGQTFVGILWRKMRRVHTPKDGDEA